MVSTLKFNRYVLMCCCSLFSGSWKDLNEAIDQRALKLQGAGEIHRFNRDVEDALSRIQEKYASIPDGLGRDLKQTQAYQKSHAAFENELVALEAQARHVTLVHSVSC